jgi:hypothetical protein
MTKYNIFYIVKILKQQIPINIAGHSKVTGSTAKMH